MIGSSVRLWHGGRQLYRLSHCCPNCSKHLFTGRLYQCCDCTSARRSETSTRAASPLWVENGGLPEEWSWTNWGVPSSGMMTLKALEKKTWTERERSKGRGASRTWKAATCHWYVSQSDRWTGNICSFVCTIPCLHLTEDDAQQQGRRTKTRVDAQYGKNSFVITSYTVTVINHAAICCIWRTLKPGLVLVLWYFYKCFLCCSWMWSWLWDCNFDWIKRVYTQAPSPIAMYSCCVFMDGVCFFCTNRSTHTVLCLDCWKIANKIEMLVFRWFTLILIVFSCLIFFTYEKYFD